MLTSLTEPSYLEAKPHPPAIDAGTAEEDTAEQKRQYPFTPARLFSYTRTLEARIIELEKELAEKDAFVTHLANMGLAMRGIPPVKQQQRRSQPPKFTAKPRTMAQIHKANQERFEGIRQNAQTSSRSEEERAMDAQDVQGQINAVLAIRSSR